MNLLAVFLAVSAAWFDADVAVRVGGVEVAAAGERVYEIPTNAVVTVAFAAERGYVLSSPTMRFEMTQSMSLPEAGRPMRIDPAAITVSEFMAAPTNGTDWVELRNATNVDVEVAGWLITDDYTKKISKWKTIEGDAVVPANGYLVVQVDGDVTAWPAGVAHAKLGLSDEGEALGLATPDGETVTSRVDFGLQFDEVSCGFAPEASALSYFREPTPGAANVTKASRPPTPKVALSVAHGWKDEPFDLEMTTDDPADEIRYTLDGSAPTKESFLYESPLRIDRSSVDAPTLSKGKRELADGAVVVKGAKLSLRVPDGATVYFTLDGSDPRQFGGELNPSASAYDAGRGVAIRTLGMICVNARARDPKGVWSALESVRLNVSSGFMLLIK